MEQNLWQKAGEMFRPGLATIGVLFGCFGKQK